jgi:hypothetical protein
MKAKAMTTTVRGTATDQKRDWSLSRSRISVVFIPKKLVTNDLQTNTAPVSYDILR